MNNEAKQIILTTGIKAFVGKMTGVTQRLLSQTDGRDFREKLNDVLSALIYKVGDVDLTALSDKERTAFIESMTSADRKVCLVEIRSFSVDEPVFEFTYPYKNMQGVSVEEPMEFDLTGAFEVVRQKHLDEKLLESYRRPNGTISNKSFGELAEKLQPVEFDSYEQVLANKHVFFNLPSGQRCRIAILDRVGETILMNTKEKNRSTHTPLLMRNPCRVLEGDGNTAKVISYTSSDLDKMSLADIEFIRSISKLVEGTIHTELTFDHPEADRKPEGQKEVVIDLMDQMSFFYTSGKV